MQAITHWFAMGGYGSYVWSAYGFSFIVIMWLIFSTKHQHKQVLRRLQRRRQLNRSESDA